MMGRQSTPKFGMRLPILALTAAAVLLLAGVAVVLFAEHSYRQERIGELRVQAQILAATVTAAMEFQDHEAAHEYVAALDADPALRAAAVYDAKGALFASYAAPDAAPVPDSLRPGVVPAAEGRLVVTEPVMLNGTMLGTVYIRTLTEPFQLRLQRYSAIALLAIMAALVAGVLGLGQAALARANAALEKHAVDLAAANASLEQQIAERERVEDSLRQAQKMEAVGQLTGGIAHDFNNLLQVILGNIDVLRSQVRAGDRAFDKKLEAAQRAGERAAVLVAQLLAFARRQRLDARPIEINKLVAGMSDLLRRTLGEAITIETGLAPDLRWVSADGNQLENALLNLAVNARDAMPGGGRLRIETRNVRRTEPGAAAQVPAQAADYVVIAVSDTGTGMSKEVVAKVFEPFFTTKGIGRGSGLGLSQVYGFVTQSGGHVEISSEPGTGTVVEIFLPSVAGPAQPGPAVSLPREIPQGHAQELILLVEDEENVRAINLEMLRDLGYPVIEAADGHAALRMLDAEPRIRLLFSDIGLPGGLSGTKLAAEARSRRPDLPILLTTGYARSAISDYPDLVPDVGQITKPFTYTALAEKIRETLEGAKPLWTDS